MARQVYWLSPAPEKCDMCGAEITTIFYDAKTRMGPWGCMCTTCFNLAGPGRLGTGYGQKFEKQKDGKWLKTQG